MATVVYINLDMTCFLKTSEEYTAKVAKTKQGICALIELSSIIICRKSLYVSNRNNTIAYCLTVFKRRKKKRRGYSLVQWLIFYFF